MCFFVCQYWALQPLAGERLRPLGHISTDAYSQANIGITRRKSHFSKFARGLQKPVKMALNGTERHRVWERFGQLPSQTKRVELGQSEQTAAITFHLPFRFVHRPHSNPPTSTDEIYQIIPRRSFRCGPTEPRFSS